jgi:drug/metabolite transporter (DMT)-like permease
VTPWNYFGAIFALLIGFVFFGEIPLPVSILGMGLIVTGVLLNARVKKLS